MTQQADELKQGIETVENTIDDNAEMDAEEQEILDAETYRWEWSNPDLAKVDSGVRPSDIKQAMLKDVTPELREKIIQITQKQDPWTDIVERSGVVGFSKELALNCFIKSQTEDEIQLGLHSEKAHLKQDRNIKNLVEHLERLYEKPVKLSIFVEDSDVLTPMDYRKKFIRSCVNRRVRIYSKIKNYFYYKKSLMRSWMLKAFDQFKTRFSKF